MQGSVVPVTNTQGERRGAVIDLSGFSQWTLRCGVVKKCFSALCRLIVADRQTDRQTVVD